MHSSLLLKTCPCQSQVLDYVISFPQDDFHLLNCSENDVLKFLLFCLFTSATQT